MSTVIRLRKNETTKPGPSGSQRTSSCGPVGCLPGTRRPKENVVKAQGENLGKWLSRAKRDRRSLSLGGIDAAAAGAGPEVSDNTTDDKPEIERLTEKEKEGREGLGAGSQKGSHKMDEREGEG